MAQQAVDVPVKNKLELLKLLCKTRMTEERLIALYRQGQIAGGVYTSRGVEATTVGAAYALKTQDYLFPIHRDLGAHLAKGQSVLNIFLQYLGKGNSLTKGKESGLHASDTSLNIIGNVSHLGAMIPVAVGAGLGKAMQGEKVVSLNFIGEGGSNVGDFHEGLNFAAVQNAPFVLVIENNQYAYSTPYHTGNRCKKLSDRAIGYGIPGHQIDGTDVLTVYSVVKEAVEKARNGDGPTLIECISMRMIGHSAHDDASYVDKDLLKSWQQKDPITNLEIKLPKPSLITKKQIDKMIKDLEKEIEDAVQKALAGPPPDPQWAYGGIYAE